MYSSACASVLYIFQLPAISGVRAITRRPPRLRAPRRPGSVAPLDQLERRAAAGREVVDRVLQAELRERRRRVAAADDRHARRAPRPPRRRARVPAANGSSSKAPIGPFQNTVPARRDLARVALRASRGPMSRPIQPSGTSTPSSTRCARVGGEALADHEVAGQLDARAARVRAPSRARARGVLGVLLVAQRVADRVALRAQEREAHRAADDDDVGELEEAVDHARSCRPPWRRRRPRPAGAAGCSRIAVSVLHLAFEQPPGGARQQVRDALGAGVRAVRGAERVVDVDVGELGERARELGVVARLARLEADVLEHQDLAVGERLGQRPDLARRRPPGRASRARRSARAAARRRAPATGPPRAGPRGARGARRAPAARRAPRSSSIVGSAARMRVSSATAGRPSARSSGTLKSTRTSTRLPRTSRSSMLLIARSSIGPCSVTISPPALLRPACSQDPLHQVHQAVGVAPLVVVPGDDLDHRALDHRGQFESTIEENGDCDDVGRDDRVLGVAAGCPPAARSRRPPSAPR